MYVSTHIRFPYQYMPAADCQQMLDMSHFFIKYTYSIHTYIYVEGEEANLQLAKKVAISKSTIFVLSSRNFVKVTISRVSYFEKVS